MYICLCNGITEKALRTVVRQYRPDSINELRRIIPVGTKCGKCLGQARKIFQTEQEHILIYNKVA